MMLRAQLTKLQKAQDATMVEHSTTVTRLMKNIEELRQQLLAKPGKKTLLLTSTNWSTLLLA